MKLTGSDISALYEANSHGVLRFAMRRTFDAQVSVDVVGETFAIAFEQRGKFRGSSEAELRSWVFGIASNLLAEYFRSGKTERRATERLGVERVEVDCDEIARIEQLAGSSELRAAVASALAELGDESRQAVRLRIVDELSYAEVAGAMQVTEQVARARVSRGLKKLRDKLEVERTEGAIEHV